MLYVAKCVKVCRCVFVLAISLDLKQRNYNQSLVFSILRTPDLINKKPFTKSK